MLSKGFIYKSIDYKESSKIVYLYTKEGKISFKALGVNKKNNPFSSVLLTSNIIDYEITASNFPSLINASISYSFMNDIENLKIVEALRIIIELLNIMPEDINHEANYMFLEKTLFDLKINSDKALAIFLIKMLYNFGINPNFKECLKCGKKDSLVEISPYLGGALCDICGNNHNYDIWNEYYHKKSDINNYKDTDFHKLLNEINEYYKIHLNYDLKLK